MDKFRAYRIDEQDGKIVAGFQSLTVEDLTPEAKDAMLQIFTDWKRGQG